MSSLACVVQIDFLGWENVRFVPGEKKRREKEREERGRKYIIYIEMRKIQVRSAAPSSIVRIFWEKRSQVKCGEYLLPVKERETRKPTPDRDTKMYFGINIMQLVIIISRLRAEIKSPGK